MLQGSAFVRNTFNAFSVHTYAYIYVHTCTYVCSTLVYVRATSQTTVYMCVCGLVVALYIRIHTVQYEALYTLFLVLMSMSIWSVVYSGCTVCSCVSQLCGGERRGTAAYCVPGLLPAPPGQGVPQCARRGGGETKEPHPPGYKVQMEWAGWLATSTWHFCHCTYVIARTWVESEHMPLHTHTHTHTHTHRPFSMVEYFVSIAYISAGEECLHGWSIQFKLICCLVHMNINSFIRT